MLDVSSGAFEVVAELYINVETGLDPLLSSRAREVSKDPSTRSHVSKGVVRALLSPSRLLSLLLLLSRDDGGGGGVRPFLSSCRLSS